MRKKIAHYIKSGILAKLKKSRDAETIGLRLAHVSKNLRPHNLRRPVDWVGKIEIIIPCYNHAKYLPEAWQSILDQTYKKPITVTFVDDCSTDNSFAILEQLKAQDVPDWITLNIIRNKNNLRQWATLNKTIAESKNELIVILNDDDMLRKDCLEKIIKTYLDYPEIWMLGASSIWLENNRPQNSRKIESFKKLDLSIHEPDETFQYRFLNDLRMTQSSNSFFRIGWKHIGGYRDKKHRITFDANEDRDFQMRYASVFKVGTYEDYPFAYWRTDTSNGKEF